MPKKPKIKPTVITSRDAMEAIVSQTVNLKLQVAALKVAMEQEIAKIQAAYQSEIDPLQREITVHEAGLHVWAEQNKSEFGARKSIELQTATLGFRTTPPAVEKSKKGNWDDVALRLASYKADGFIGENYVAYGEPKVNKEAILRDRDEIPASVLRAVGIAISQEEVFYITPKSDVLPATKQEMKAK